MHRGLAFDDLVLGRNTFKRPHFVNVIGNEGLDRRTRQRRRGAIGSGKMIGWVVVVEGELEGELEYGG